MTAKQTTLLPASLCLKTELLAPICLRVPGREAVWHLTRP